MSLFPDPPAPKSLPSHDTLPSISEIKKKAKLELFTLLPTAIATIKRCCEFPDPEDGIALKAAMAIMDRTGFGTHSTIALEDASSINHTALTIEELQARFDKSMAMLRGDAEIPSGDSIH